MLSRDLLPLERAVYRAAREQLSSDNQAEQAGFDAEQRDRAAAAVVGPIIDDPALYQLIPERHSDAQGRIYDEAYQDVLRATINDLYYFGPLEDLLYDSPKSWSTRPMPSGSSATAGCTSRTCASKTTTT